MLNEIGIFFNEYLPIAGIICSIICIVFFIFDIILLTKLNNSGLLVDNRYFNFHKKYGIIKMNLLKMSALILFIYHLFKLESQVRIGSTFMIIFCYVAVIIRLFIDYKTVKEEKNKADKLGLD